MCEKRARARTRFAVGEPPAAPSDAKRAKWSPTLKRIKAREKWVEEEGCAAWNSVALLRYQVLRHNFLRES